MLCCSINENWYLQGKYFIKEGLYRVGRNTHSQLSMFIMFLIHMFHHNFCHRLSATCVHVSAILHALVSITCSSQPNPSSVVNVDNDADTVASPT